MGVSVLVLIVATAATGPAQVSACAKDLEQLQGLWRFRTMDVDVPKGGILAPQAEIKKWQLSFKGNTYQWIVPGAETQAETFNLHVGRKSKWINMTNTVRITPTRTDGKPAHPSEIQTETWKLYGIYELDQNTLMICLPIGPTGSNIRPTEFTGRQGSGCKMWVLERVQKKQ